MTHPSLAVSPPHTAPHPHTSTIASRAASSPSLLKLCSIQLYSLIAHVLRRADMLLGVSSRSGARVGRRWLGLGGARAISRWLPGRALPSRRKSQVASLDAPLCCAEPYSSHYTAVYTEKTCYTALYSIQPIHHPSAPGPAGTPNAERGPRARVCRPAVRLISSVFSVFSVACTRTVAHRS
jgi:hypothetical protein